MTIARNWLISNYLPKPWCFAVKTAVVVSNYISIQLDNGLWSTPFEQVYNQKPDWHNLIPMFCVSYAKRYRGAKISRDFLDCQTIKIIYVGNDPASDSILFHLPFTQQFISSTGYTVDPSFPSGPVFSLKYDGKLQWKNYFPYSITYTPPVFTPEVSVWVKLPDIHE